MADLQLLNGHRGRKISISECVAYKWKELAVALNFGVQRIDRIDLKSSRVDEEVYMQDNRQD